MRTRINGDQIVKEDLIKGTGSPGLDWEDDENTASMKAIHSLLEEASDRHFTYEWRVLSATVSVQHNLHKKPSVTVMDTGGNELFCDVAYVDEDNVLLTFSTPVRGTAYFN